MAADRVALVTGGAVRVGGSISRALAADGWAVAVNYNHSERAAGALVDELGDAGHRAAALKADVTDRFQVERLIDATVERFGGLGLLVNNAAVFERRPFLEIEPELWEQTVAVNLSGAFRVAQAAARIMWRAGRGRIVNICGSAGIHPIGVYAPYCSAKAGLDMLTRCMAHDLAPRIQVNGVAPGTVLFPEGTSEAEQRGVVGRVPAGRVGAPEDVAAAVCFLATAPDYITGTIIRVDGGASLVGR